VCSRGGAVQTRCILYTFYSENKLRWKYKAGRTSCTHTRICTGMFIAVCVSVTVRRTSFMCMCVFQCFRAPAAIAISSRLSRSRIIIYIYMYARARASSSPLPRDTTRREGVEWWLRGEGSQLRLLSRVHKDFINRRIKYVPRIPEMSLLRYLAGKMDPTFHRDRVSNYV